MSSTKIYAIDEVITVREKRTFMTLTFFFFLFTYQLNKSATDKVPWYGNILRAQLTLSLRKTLTSLTFTVVLLPCPTVLLMSFGSH